MHSYKAKEKEIYGVRIFHQIYVLSLSDLRSERQKEKDEVWGSFYLNFQCIFHCFSIFTQFQAGENKYIKMWPCQIGLTNIRMSYIWANFATKFILQGAS